MKAAVYYENGPPSVLRYEDVPDPVLDDASVASGGRAYWRPSGTGTLGPVSALILSEGAVRKSLVR